jgi:uncharacterized RDD family membrane protein YckC
VRVRFLPDRAQVGGLEVADLGERVGSHAIDVALQAGVQAAMLLAIRGDVLVDSITAIAEGANITATLRSLLAAEWPNLALAVLLAWLIGGILDVAMHSIFGASVGKLLIRIEVRHLETGGFLSPRQAFVRWLGLGWMAPASLVSPAAQVLPFAGYAMAWFDPLRRALHDRVAGAVVVRKQRAAG